MTLSLMALSFAVGFWVGWRAALWVVRCMLEDGKMADLLEAHGYKGGAMRCSNFRNVEPGLIVTVQEGAGTEEDPARLVYYVYRAGGYTCLGVIDHYARGGQHERVD